MYAAPELDSLLQNLSKLREKSKRDYLARIKLLEDALTVNLSISHYASWPEAEIKAVREFIAPDLSKRRSRSVSPSVQNSDAPRSKRVHNPPAVLAPQLQIYAQRLPYRPYVSNDLTVGLSIASREAADLFKYIQHNAPQKRAWLVFDCDYEGALEKVKAQQLPLPNFVATNPKNGHSHLFYGLAAPVCTSDIGKRKKPFWLLQRLEFALGEALGGDTGYMGLISKNLLNEAWQVEAPRDELWSLLDFQQHVTLPKKLPKKATLIGVGRNVTLFHTVRQQAYKDVLAFRLAGSFEGFHQTVISHAQTVNSGFPQPLFWAEVRSVAKSIARWTWKHYTGRVSDEEFSETQARRGRAGGVKSGLARMSASAEKRAVAMQLRADGHTLKDIAATLSTPLSTVARWCKH